MGIAYGLEFPKGSSQVTEFLTDFVNKQGFNNLKNVAKIHFKITDQFKKKSGYK
jgi:ribonuclease HIII